MTKNVSKADLVFSLIEGGNNLTKKEATSYVDSLIGKISEELASGSEINIAGFGKFSIAKRSARVGRNPKTGENLTIPASASVKFSPAKALKTAVQPLADS
jgi:DNA-binding protein HU-beta